MSLGEMAWEVYKEEIMRLTMVRIRRSFKRTRENLENAIYDQGLDEDVNSYIGGKIDGLTAYIEAFCGATKVAEKDLDDFAPAAQSLIRDTLVDEAKGLARRRMDQIGQ